MATPMLYARKIMCTGNMHDTTMTAVTARVFLTSIQITFTVTVDLVGYKLAAVSAGNVRVAIYEDNGDTPVGGALVVESASVAKSAAFRVQEVAVANTQLKPGLYWLAIQSDEATSTINLKELSEKSDATLGGKRYDLGGYGAFTDPCPATNDLDDVPSMFVMVASIP